MRECSNYENCNATICPLDITTRDIAMWYPDEDICGSLLFRKERWRIAQRKIAKRTRNIDSYFTFAMLNTVKAVGNGIRGASPDRSSELMTERQACFINDRARKSRQGVRFGVSMPFSSLERGNGESSSTDSIGHEQKKEG